MDDHDTDNPRTEVDSQSMQRSQSPGQPPPLSPRLSDGASLSLPSGAGSAFSSSSSRLGSFSSTHYQYHQHHHHHQHGQGGVRLPNPPSVVEWSGMRFLIMDAPSESNLDLYLRELKRQNVTDLVRVCDPTYSREAVERQNIRIHEMLFPDGDGPPENVITAWNALVDSRFHPKKEKNGNAINGEEGYDDNGDNASQASRDCPIDDPKETIAVHCVAGLGRAPVLVAIALIEAGMSPLDAVTYLRERRRGAINTKQLHFLESYRRRSSSGQRCFIM